MIDDTDIGGGGGVDMVKFQDEKEEENVVGSDMVGKGPRSVGKDKDVGCGCG